MTDMKIILRREDYDGANMSESHDCVDRGCNTAPAMPSGQRRAARDVRAHRNAESVARGQIEYD
jgi:hypothetical protein